MPRVRAALLVPPSVADTPSPMASSVLYLRGTHVTVTGSTRGLSPSAAAENTRLRGLGSAGHVTASSSGTRS